MASVNQNNATNTLSHIKSANEADYHTRPPSPSNIRGPGLDGPLFWGDLKSPAGYGELSRVHLWPRGSQERDGYHEFIYAPPRAPETATEYKIHRSNANPRPNDPLYHPKFEGYYNYEGRRFEQLTASEKRILEIAVHYPDIQNGIMKAPLYFRRGSFAQPEAKQPEAFRRVFGTHELLAQILSYITHRYEDLANLCRTSQFAAGMVQSIWMHLDATKNDFLGWNRDKLTDVRGGRTFSPFVMISPIRQDQGPVQKVITSKTGYPITPSVEKSEQTDLASSMRAHYSLLHLSYFNGHAIRHLILHAMPWVNVATIECIVPEMRMLESLGVHQCFLMNLGDAQPLLRVINDKNKERLELKLPHVALDFSPYYFKGPPYKEDGTGHVGEYGVIPEDEEDARLGTNRAVTAQLLAIWDLCQEGDQDFFTPGTGFRAYLERLPVRTLPGILECIATIYDFKTEKYHSGVGVPGWCEKGTHLHYHRGSNKPCISKDLEASILFTLWARLIVSCNGRAMTKEKLQSLLQLGNDVKLEHCVICNTDMAAYFFSRNILPLRADCIFCHGCEIEMWLSNHIYRLVAWRRKIANDIFIRKDGRKRSLWRVLKNIAKPARPAAGPDKPARDAILSLPGAVDVTFLERAQRVWEALTIHIPDSIIITEKALKMIDEDYENASFDERIELAKKREEIEEKQLDFECRLGTNQHNYYCGSLERNCRSWELNIRDRFTEMALERGWFVNHGPVPIFNVESNAADMLGSWGGLREYWTVQWDGENGTASYKEEAIISGSCKIVGEEEAYDDWDDSAMIALLAAEASSSQAESVVPYNQTTPQTVTQAVPIRTQELTPQNGSQPAQNITPHQRRREQQAAQPQSSLPPHQWRPAGRGGRGRGWGRGCLGRGRGGC
ncbi:hypothetical protein F5Y10DRAFT_292392 [Nemania abortiva]|nr:hypothetical protein F5Y10DRAFT_292392 [Nemania abortiva]